MCGQVGARTVEPPRTSDLCAPTPRQPDGPRPFPYRGAPWRRPRRATTRSSDGARYAALVATLPHTMISSTVLTARQTGLGGPGRASARARWGRFGCGKIVDDATVGEEDRAVGVRGGDGSG